MNKISNQTRAEALRGLGEQAKKHPAEAAERALNVNSLFSINGKVAVLTDLEGIGSRQIAELLAAAGAHVIVAATHAEASADHAATLRGSGLSAYAVQVDIENEADITDFFKDVADTAGRIDITVNCAGMSAKIPFLETSMDVFDRMQSLNLRSNFMCTREAVRQMVATKSPGRIVNVTSICGVHPVTHDNAAYAATRQGVTGISRTTALDYAKDGILANTILVGAVQNRVTVHPTSVARRSTGAPIVGPLNQPGRLPFGFGDMYDVSAAVLYLVSPAGRYITGQEIVLDGGFLLT